MSPHITASVRAPWAAALVVALTLGSLTATSAVAAEQPATWPLLVSEIAPDNAGTPDLTGGTTGDQDQFEFFEITNLSTAAIDLRAGGYALSYIYNATGSPTDDTAEKPLTVTETTPVIPAGASAVFWLQYKSGSTVDSTHFTDAEFRSHVGAPADVPLFHVTGQAGMANSGTRGIRIAQNGETVTWSSYTRDAADKGRSTHFGVPTDTSSRGALSLGDGAYTAGTVTDAQKKPAVVTPIDPTATPTPTPTPDPTGSATPTPTPTATAPAVGPGAAGNAGRYFPLAITEILGDNPGTDLYEYLEVTNTTDQPIDLDAQKIGIRYNTSQWNAGSDQPVFHQDGDGATATVIPAGGVALFWMNYKENSTQRSMSIQQFRDYYSLGADVPVFRFGNQEGFANGGNRGFSLVKDGTVINRAWVGAGKIDSDGGVVQFGVPSTIGATDAVVVAENAPRTPGAVTTAQVTSALTRPTDSTLASPILQITELAPDTVNVNSSDGYEFIEVYNASDAPVNFGDYVINYIYTDNSLSGPVSEGSTQWPATPANPVIQPGKALVLWVKNGNNSALTAADFNSQFGTSLVAGENLVELSTSGMANGGSRGIQISTNTGTDVSRAYYFTDDQTTPTTAIQYAWNPQGASPIWAPQPADGTVQTLLRLDTPTPGSVSDDQVRPALRPAPAAGTAPVITDLTGGTEMPSTPGLDLGFDITDDHEVRTVTLTLTDNLGATITRNLTFGAANRYLYAVPQADLFGKRWVEYTVTATDGSQTSTLGPVRVPLTDATTDPVRLNLTDGQFVSGQVRVQGTSDAAAGSLALTADGSVLAATTPSLEDGPIFAFEATNTDAFFRNGVLLGDDVLKIFDEGYYERIVTVDAAVPVTRVEKGKPLTLTVTSGTKAKPYGDPNENNDDFSAMNFRLALPDGRVLHPVSCATRWEADGAVTAPAPYTCATGDKRVNFSDDTLVSIDLTFDVPDDAFDSIAATWDTTKVADGAHAVAATDGNHALSRSVQVDNTAPVITTALTDGQLYRGDFTVDGSAADAGSGLDTLTATLDGAAVTLPLATSSLTLTPGDHTAVFTARDHVGNTATRTIAFRTADERPGITLLAPSAGGTVTGDKATLSATATSAQADALDLSFRRGYTFTPAQSQVHVASGSTTTAAAGDRTDATPLSADDLAKLSATDGVDVAATSDTAFPYQLFTVDVPTDSGSGALARVAWDGRANADAKVLLYARKTDGSWEKVDQYLTTGGAATTFTLKALVPVDGHATGGKLTFLVQHSEGFAGTARSSRTDSAAPYNAGATPRSDYDFTIGWESDTQYYNENQGYLAGTTGDDKFYQHQVDIHDFLLKQRDNLNLQYVMHTGDIVDDYIATERAAGNDDPEYEWKNADAQYKRFDEAGLPYGILAGNHDVGHAADDYSNFSKYFGESRYSGNPWYGGSYKDNRGHYDLMTVGGVDFLMLYMGWPAVNNTASNDEDIAWMNSVIARYPERKVWIDLHEYMLTTGGLGPIPQRIFDEVVKANPNVFAVSSGHYHDAYTRTDAIDDNGDGQPDRTVYSMLFDYQGLQEGGLGYLRLLHFDNKDGRIIIRTYSPSLDVFDSQDPALTSPEGMQEFTIPYAAIGLKAQTKTLATDSFRADILTADEVGTVAKAPSGSVSTVDWKGLTAGEHGWYVQATGPHGGLEYSEVRTFTTTAGTGGGTDQPGTGGGTDQPGTGGGTDQPGTGGGTNQPGTGGGTSAITLTLSADQVAAGGTVRVQAQGLVPSASYRLVLHSTPVRLATVTAGADGTIDQSLLIPQDTALGAHALQLSRADAPDTIVASAALTVTAPGLAATGGRSDDLGGVLTAGILLLLAGLVVVMRRRRHAH